ncbi:MAG TPA: OmpA family protein [Thermoanaerobaculia bacterium]
MNKKLNILVMLLVFTMTLLLPACRSSRKTVPAPVPDATQTAPAVPAPPLPSDTAVSEPRDFVDETPREETFPADIEQLNRYVQERGYIRDAFFNYDEAGLDSAAQAALTASANWLRGREGIAYNLLIEGHCDERGTEQYNLALGDRRANAARDFLVTMGVDSRRIRTVSYGEERPFASGSNESAWSQNRRAHLVLVR